MPLTEQEQAAQDAEDADTTAAQQEFFTTLDAMYGEDINSNIDYGDIDPTSAEGVYRREQHMIDLGASRFEQFIKEEDPRAYAYFLHRKNGGSDEEFYAIPSTVLPSLQEVKDDIDLQRKVYKQLLEGRGNNERQVAALVKMATDSGELASEAEIAWNEIKTRESADFERVDQNNAQRLEKERKDITEMDTVINNTISTAENLRFVIPDNEKASFAQKVKELVHYEDGNFFLLKPLTKENIGTHLEAELFNHLKGDLSKLIARKATTVSAQRLIKKAKEANGGPPAGGGGTNSGFRLGDILPK